MGMGRELDRPERLSTFGKKIREDFMKKILLSISFIFLIGLFPEQLFARELSRSEIDRSSFNYKSLITKVILIENDNERQRMLIEIKLYLSLHKYYSARIENRYSPVDGEYFVIYNTGSQILIAIGSSAFEINLYRSQYDIWGNNISGISEIGENTYDKIVESIEMFEFINLAQVPEREPVPIFLEPEWGMSVPDGFEYEVVDGRSVTITSYTGDATTINIPAQIQGLPVTAIGDYAFSSCSSLTSVTIPSSVTSIGYGAFLGCSSLTSIIIPSSITSIRNLAFAGCRSLTSVTIPSSVTSIGNEAFEDCSSLTSVIIPSSITSIGDSAFSSCSSLTSVTIPSSVTSIGSLAFNYCYRLTSITIPSSVTSIGGGAFYGCSSLTSVTLSRRTRVGEGTFPETARIVYRD
jgi:hypothetical protein